MVAAMLLMAVLVLLVVPPLQLPWVALMLALSRARVGGGGRGSVDRKWTTRTTFSRAAIGIS